MTYPIKPERAREILQQSNQFPYWGNTQKFMTNEEVDAVHAYWIETGNGNSSFNSTLEKIGRTDREGPTIDYTEAGAQHVLPGAERHRHPTKKQGDLF
jgi:hypothetical protein